MAPPTEPHGMACKPAIVMALRACALIALHSVATVYRAIRDARNESRALLGRPAAFVLLCGVLSAGVATSEPAEAAPGTPLVVTTSGGAVQGATVGTVDEFLGIPYAAPPVGALRWKPPQPPARWSGTRLATTFGPHCPQPASSFGLASMSENCLYLNVYAPKHTKTNAGSLPVMVYIHGGVFVWGESNDYDPAGLVQHGVIVVTMNYRLGALGFLAHPGLTDRSGGPSGNYGLMDQQAALRWVQANISRFGGDPRKVTLFGESAGGLSVLSQVASPGARGLFARAIVESGTYTLTPVSLATAEAAGESFAASAGCPDQSAACLRALPVATILKYQDAGGYRPNIDGQVLTESLESGLAGGDFNHVPVLIGTNHDERRLFVALAQLAGDPVTTGNYESMIQSSLGVSPATAAEVVARYPLSRYASPALAFAAVGTDDSFACDAMTADESLSKYVRTYSYEFNDENAPERYEPPVGFPYGAAHASELQYLFRLSNTPFPGVLKRGQRSLAGTMRTYWTNFAKDGNPSSAGVPEWKPFNRASHQTMSLDTPSPHVETTFVNQHNCAFWDRIH